MKFTTALRNSAPYFLAILIFLLVAFLYFSPVMSGKALSMHDEVMSRGNAKELVDYKEKTGEWAWWTNSVFGGMPGNMIAGSYSNSIASNFGSYIYGLLPLPVNLFFFLMVGFFIFMGSLKKPLVVSMVAAIAYAFGTYNLLYTEAGHISKILALAYAPALLGGFVLIYRKKYLLGTFVTAFFLALELQANHLQITYYFIFILFAYFAYKSFQLIKQGETKVLLTTLACLSVAVLVGVSSHTMRLWNNLVYSKESTRGVSELTASTAGNQGLDKDYIFGWSYGIGETFNLIVPDIMGGGSVGSLTTDSETFKTLTAGQVDPNTASQFIQQLPLYFGDQPITSGPAYSGVLVVFLFILGLFIVKGRFKWIIFGLTIFFIALAWGDNFSSFNYLIVEYLPGYNKFRAVTMTLVIVHFLLVWGAANTLSAIFGKEITWTSLKKPLTYSLGIIVGLMLMGYFSLDYVGAKDTELRASLSQGLGADFANKVTHALQKDRKDMAWGDVTRGLFLLLVTGAALWAYANKKASARIISSIVFFLVVFDLVSVGKRYFNNADFVRDKKDAVPFQPTAADLEILKDKDPNFKVLNISTSFSSDSRDSYFHKSLGGYHGAKLKKTQELFDHQLITEAGQLNMPVINMLNTKYLITRGENGPVAQRNPEALGNAWFVDSLTVVDNADLELAFLANFNPKSTAVTQKNQGLETATFKTDSSAHIVLTSYAPNKLVYSASNPAAGYAVFSEIYYRGNKDWVSSIDGKSVNHQKVDYLLRGMEIPAGKHEIVFEYRPKAVQIGSKVDLVVSIALILLAIGAIYASVKSEKD